MVTLAEEVDDAARVEEADVRRYVAAASVQPLPPLLNQERMIG